MKRIFKLSIVIVFAVIIASCTDEKDFIDNKPSKNNKNMEEGMQEREYKQYEQIDYGDDLVEMLNNFDAILNQETYNRETYSISEALVTMETYFNYAIVDKQTEYDENISYEKQSISFTAPLLNEDTINLLSLRDIYLDFISNVLTSMGDKYLQFSDIYVSEIDESYITFTLEMAPFNPNIGFTHPRAKIVRPIEEDIHLPQGAFSEWKDLTQGMIDVNLRGYVRLDVDKVIHQIQWIAQPFFPGTMNLWIFQEDPDWLDPAIYQSTWYRTGEELRDLVYNTMYETYQVASIYFPGRTPIDVFNAINQKSNGNLVKKGLYFAEIFYAYTSDEYLRNYVNSLSFNFDLIN